MRITRAAFAVMLKFSDMYLNFEFFASELCREIDGLKGKERDSAAEQVINDSSEAIEILEKFAEASKMRKWISWFKLN